MKHTIKILIALLVLLFALPAYATYVVNFDNGTINSTTALTGYTTFGDMMDGMQVKATFATGGSETFSWADTGAGSGGVSGTNWSLSESGDTYTSNWTLTSSVPLASIFIDAGLGDTVFDITWNVGGDVEGTPGSEQGRTFEITSDHSALNVTATYIDIVALSGSSPIGDLWRLLSIDFNNAPLTGTMTYRSDTDNLKFAGDINPIPEPSTIFLLVAGLAGVGLLRKRFKN